MQTETTYNPIKGESTRSTGLKGFVVVVGIVVESSGAHNLNSGISFDENGAHRIVSVNPAPFDHVTL